MLFKSSISLIFILFFVSCAGIPPIQEYSLARTAIHSAQKFNANKYSPKYYSKAVNLYREGERAFEQRNYGVAEDHFDLCVEFAEKSENFTRWARYKKGDYSL